MQKENSLQDRALQRVLDDSSIELLCREEAPLPIPSEDLTAQHKHKNKPVDQDPDFTLQELNDAAEEEMRHIFSDSQSTQPDTQNPTTGAQQPTFNKRPRH